MGAWGTALFSDDMTADLRGDFHDLIGEGLSAEEATAKLVSDYRPDLDPVDQGIPFWLALASVQWSLGRLLPDVREKALDIIHSGADLARWELPKDRKKREAVLEKLKTTLESPQPPPRKVPRRVRAQNDWPVGSVHAYRLRSGKYCLFYVAGHHQDKGGRFACLELFDWRGEELPAQWQVHLLRRRKQNPVVEKTAVCGMILLGENKLEAGRWQKTSMSTWVRGREIPALLRIRPYPLWSFIWKMFRVRRASHYFVFADKLDDFLVREGFQ